MYRQVSSGLHVQQILSDMDRVADPELFIPDQDPAMNF